ncbi:glycoside hydrolase family 3 C-terminal domain-containing protein [Paenibacillus vortex]|uniref:glycoside hydrolase family 3 C-terminal domain-containing protein n=1 Tax=Paenibacillus vortex TaxID=71995 RepID=UPI003AF28D57
MDKVVRGYVHVGDAVSPRDNEKLVNKLAELEGVSIVVVATRNPYDMNDLPPVATYLCSYENTPYYMNAAAGVLLGKVIPEGKLPVSISDTYPLGWSGHQDYVNN